MYTCVSIAPVTQHSASKSRKKGYENLVDVVVSGNFWPVMVWPSAFCSTAEALPKHD